MKIDPTIFKAYDVRGIYPGQLNKVNAKAIGYCFAKINKAKRIIIGRDMRISSDIIFESIAQGINQAGAEAIDIGLVSTDVSYFASGKLKLPAIMITASHNPKEWNGFKLTEADAIPFGEKDIQKLKQAVIKYKNNHSSIKNVTNRDILPDYNKNVLSFIDLSKITKLKIVVDAGNGMGGKILSPIFSKLPCKIIPLYFKLDGSFPNHQPSPIESKNLIQLQKKVLQAKADLGMAFDGDADRVFFIDEKGDTISGVSIVAILAEYFLKQHKGERVIYDLRCSHFIPELIKANGGIPLISRVGHSFIKSLMKKTGAVFGGELSGHYYFRDNYRADSAMVAAAIMTQIISEAKMPLSQLIKRYVKYYQIEETSSKTENKMAKFEEIKIRYKTGKITELDGVTVEYPEWWFNLRPSNTEPLLRLNLEAKTKKLMEEKAKELIAILES